MTGNEDGVKHVSMNVLYSLQHLGGIPAHGNSRSGWDAGARFDFENPEYRQRLSAFSISAVR